LVVHAYKELYATFTFLFVDGLQCRCLKTQHRERSLSAKLQSRSIFSHIRAPVNTKSPSKVRCRYTYLFVS